MAIIVNGEYVSVEDVSASSVTIRFHADAAHRARYKSGTESKFETTRQEVRNVTVDLSKMADPSKSVKDNNVTEGYSALKTLEEFSESVDA